MSGTDRLPQVALWSWCFITATVTLTEKQPTAYLHCKDTEHKRKKSGQLSMGQYHGKQQDGCNHKDGQEPAQVGRPCPQVLQTPALGHVAALA